MAYGDFSVADLRNKFQIQVLPGTVFPPLNPVPVPPWLAETLERTSLLRVETEKARNEFIVAPVLLAVRELSGNRVGLFSGERFDVDSPAGLIGECDFVLTLSPAQPDLQAPAIFVVEAKKQDILGALGQCAAQMIAARRFNARNQKAIAQVFGCITTGEVWQFLRFEQDNIVYDTKRLFVNDVGRILAAFQFAVNENIARLAA